MVEDPAREYLNAKQELDKALSNWKAIYEAIKQAEDGLTYPSVLAKMTIDIQPAELAMGRGFRIDAAQWPTVQQIQDCISFLMRSYQKASGAYTNLSKDEKAVIASPDAIVQKMDPQRYG